MIPAFVRRSSRKPHDALLDLRMGATFVVDEGINGTGDGHRDVELSQMVDSRATVSFRSLAIWRPRITDRSDGPAGAVRYPGVRTSSVRFPALPQGCLSSTSATIPIRRDARARCGWPLIQTFSPRAERRNSYDPITVCSRRRPLFRLTPQALPRSRQSCRNCPSHRRRVLSRSPNSRYSAWPRLIASSPSADRNP